MKIVVTVEFDGREPVAQMIKMFGEPLARSMAESAVKLPEIAVSTDVKKPRGRPFGSTKPKPADVPAVGQPVSVAYPEVVITKEPQPVGTTAPVAAEAVKTYVSTEATQGVPVAKMTESTQGAPVAKMTEVVPVIPVKAYTLENTQAAIERLFNAKGLQPALGTLASFGVNRAQDLKPDQRAAFLERVEMIIEAK